MELTRETLDREFPSRLHSIQFNHAAVCPLPARGAEALAGYARQLSTRGPLDWKEWGAKVDEVRRLAAKLIGVRDVPEGASSVSIVPNTTWGLDLVAQGLDWRDGDEVITTESEFPANLTPWLALERRGVVVRRLPTRDGAFTLGEVASAFTGRTRLVCVSAVAFHTGFVAPVAELGALCREQGVLFGLDAIQAVGAIPVDATASHVDFLSADGHKWMLGPEGCGILFATPELRARLTPPAGWTNLVRAPGGDFHVGERPEYVKDARRFEVGALPTPGVYALAASLELLLEIGLPEIGARIGRTLGVLLEGLPQLGFTLVLFGGPPRSGILAVRPPDGRKAHEYARRLAEQGICVAARQGFLRFSPHVGNDEEEAERVLAALKA